MAIEIGPVVNGEQFPIGYTAEAAAYEQATRPGIRNVTVQLVTWDEVGTNYNYYTQEARAARLTGAHRPVTFKEWTAIERKCRKPFTARWPKRAVGFNGPPAVLEDGRTVAEVLDARSSRIPRSRI